jgi:hypothetical protein
VGSMKPLTIAVGDEWISCLLDGAATRRTATRQPRGN